MSTDKPKWPNHKDHLNKTFLEELGRQLWSTKGARFKANKRLLTKDNLSNKAMGFLSAYLIIIGLLSVYNLTGNLNVSENLLAFGTTTLSILQLTFSQMEAAQDYKIRAVDFHQCALKLAALHGELRRFKTMQKSTDEEKLKFATDLDKRYQDILEHYPNHDHIDYESMLENNKDYFGISKWRVMTIQAKYYIYTKFLYHVLILFPPLIFIWIWIRTF
jgi:hypothetical protein